jgi:hypothetical protein
MAHTPFDNPSASLRTSAETGRLCPPLFRMKDSFPKWKFRLMKWVLKRHGVMVLRKDFGFGWRSAFSAAIRGPCLGGASQFAEKLNCSSVLKGRGFFSRAVSAAKSTLALATEVTSGLRSDFFSNLFSHLGC